MSEIKNTEKVSINDKPSEFNKKSVETKKVDGKLDVCSKEFVQNNEKKGFQYRASDDGSKKEVTPERQLENKERDLKREYGKQNGLEQKYQDKYEGKNENNKGDQHPCRNSRKQEHKEIYKKWLGDQLANIKAEADKGNKRAKKILPSWEEHVKKGEIGPPLKPNSHKYSMSSKMRECQKKAEASLANKMFERFRKLAAQGDKRAIKILPDWEKSIKKGKFGPAARGDTAYGGTEDWRIATRKSILKEAMSDKSKLPKHLRGWYKQEENRIINKLKERAQNGETFAQNILGKDKELGDYVVGRMREPPGYDLGHQLGDKLGDKPGRLEYSRDNQNRGGRFRL
ncbi:hypothetical protein [Methanosarcina mazei]|uniref:Uncharacterized protein n=1 Tax=Methanosarcina mazei TaxID=2209 RepID=A0A0F8Q9S0_METMZ|nr:hypothetical protein [Methanosarcina mazei]KKF98455.1 hypothetical protein DU31_07790 [Methanosarcina mazei]KKH36610.1 hypothetical protein DU54_03785 [Methanosarcina mazei]KKH39411.1 hypothetical protein DU50_06950 [Methanosarcina mazei]KKH52035.1 hypothetical protein DU85_18260 [Methanosarcina mazei]KKH53145.1 hypothetical protein DU76_10865 [Methanosarcina mazei]